MFSRESVCLATCSYCVGVKVKLTIVNDADHYSMSRDVVAPNWHHIQVKATGAVLALRKLNTHTTTLLSGLEKGLLQWIVNC